MDEIPYEEASEWTDVPHGVPPSLVECLPTLLVEDCHEFMKETCPICLAPYLWNECLLTLPCCHTFHIDCIGTWMTTKNWCPICHQDIADSAP